MDDLHVIPNEDMIAHETSSGCICGPDPEVVGDGTILYLHHSLDGREHAEADWHTAKTE